MGCKWNEKGLRLCKRLFALASILTVCYGDEQPTTNMWKYPKA